MQYSQMELISNYLDVDRTVAATKHLLTKDLNNYLELSGKHRTDLSSPKLDVTGVSGGGGVNHTESKLTLGIAAEYCVNAIQDTLNNCKPINGQILYWKYIYRDNTIYQQKLTNGQVANRLGISDSNFYTYLKRALVEFAKRIETIGPKDHADIPQLLFYKQEDKSKIVEIQ